LRSSSWGCEMPYHSSQVLSATVAHGEGNGVDANASVTIPAVTGKRAHILWIAIYNGEAAINSWTIKAGTAGATTILTGRALVVESTFGPERLYDLQGVPISDSGVACTVELDDFTATSQVTVAYFYL